MNQKVDACLCVDADCNRGAAGASVHQKKNEIGVVELLDAMSGPSRLTGREEQRRLEESCTSTHTRHGTNCWSQGNTSSEGSPAPPKS